VDRCSQRGLTPLLRMQVPSFDLPDYCNDRDVRWTLDTEFNKPLQYKNHPCNLFAEKLLVPAWTSQLWARFLSLQSRDELWPFDEHRLTNY
jgi:hypothetical protein